MVEENRDRKDRQDRETDAPHCPGNRVPLNPYEVARMARNRGITTGEFIRRYMDEKSPFLAVDPNGACIFHGPEGCGVGSDRPLTCRLAGTGAPGNLAAYLWWARRYRNLTRDWGDARSAEVTVDSAETLPVQPEAAGAWFLDVDSVVAERCMEKGWPMPADLEERMDLHLEALRSVML